MKYRLKKDLPFAKAGTKVTLVNERKSIEYNGYQCDIYDLRDGWLEEVKPREYKLGLNKDGTFEFIWDSEGNGYDAQRKYPVAETILVREVLE